MLEIVALVFLSREIGKLAIRKNLRPGRWKLYLVLSWFSAELIGLVAGVLIFGPDNLVSIIIVGLAFAITAYYILKNRMNKFPDNDFNEEINQIGSDT